MTTTTTTNEELTGLLQAAVAAKIAYWDANRELEIALGFDDVPDKVADVIEDEISGLAAAHDDVGWIGVEEVDYLLGKIGKARVLAAAEG